MNFSDGSYWNEWSVPINHDMDVSQYNLIM